MSLDILKLANLWTPFGSAGGVAPTRRFPTRLHAAVKRPAFAAVARPPAARPDSTRSRVKDA